jgi:hypothetical protein
MQIDNELIIILFLAIILLITIAVSGIKICNINKALESRFIDRRYKYISEPFDAKSLINDITTDVNDNYISSNLSKIAIEKKENKKINELKNSIEMMELKLRNLMK